VPQADGGAAAPVVVTPATRAGRGRVMATIALLLALVGIAWPFDLTFSFLAVFGGNWVVRSVEGARFAPETYVRGYAARLLGLVGLALFIIKAPALIRIAS